jgi:basic membrane protein A
MNKRFLGFVILVVALLGLFGATYTPADPDQAGDESLVYITSAGGLTENSWNQMIYDGVLQAEENHGFTAITFQSYDINDYQKNLVDAVNLNPTMIIAAADQHMYEAVIKLAAEYTDIYFTLVDPTGEITLNNEEEEISELDNFNILYFNPEDIGFLTAILQSNHTTTGTFFALEKDTDPVNNVSIIGFSAGIESLGYSNDDITVNKMGETTEDTLTSTTYSTAVELYSNTDSLYYTPSDLTDGMLMAAAGTGNQIVINTPASFYTAIENYPENTGNILAGIFPDVTKGVADSIRTTLFGEYISGVNSFGLAGDYVNVVSTDNILAINNGDEMYNIENIDELWAEYFTAYSITVPVNSDELADFVLPEELTETLDYTTIKAEDTEEQTDEDNEESQENDNSNDDNEDTK